MKLVLGLFVTCGRWLKRHCVKNSLQFLRDIVESFLGGHREKEPVIDRRKYWGGQKVCLGSSVRWYGKPELTFWSVQTCARARICVCVYVSGVLQASSYFTGAHTSNPGPCGEGGAAVDLTEAAPSEPFWVEHNIPHPSLPKAACFC